MFYLEPIHWHIRADLLVIEYLEMDEPKREYAALSGDVRTDASPSFGLNGDDDSEDEEFLSDFRRIHLSHKSAKESKRLPFRNAVQSETAHLSSGFGQPNNDRIQVKRIVSNDILYLGELMVSGTSSIT